MEKRLIDILWVLTSGCLVFVMQAGFAMLETGMTRSKNSINVAIKNLTDFGVAVVAYWAVGFALMFGPSAAGLVGAGYFAFDARGGTWLAAFFFFQVMFCGTAATIVSGAVAERMRFSAYLLSTLLISALLYPVFGHWAWGGALEGKAAGWLNTLGFVDFAGSTVVHSMGGWMSLALLLILGPRTGRFPAGGAPRAIPGSNIPGAVLGAMLLLFGWFGFNGGSVLAFNADVAPIILNTTLAGCSGMVMSLFVGFALTRRWNTAFAINGCLAGLVAITAGCHAVNEWQALVIGAIGGMVTLGLEALLERLRIDDAVGAIPVHLGAGVWGTLAVALFGNPELLKTGLGFWGQLGAQALGVAVCGAWTFSLTWLIMKGIDRFFPLRVTPQEEQDGLNISEHGSSTEIFDLYRVMDEQSRTGDLSLRVPEEPFTEVGQIARHYNRVIGGLQTQTVAKSEYLDILDHVADGLLLVDRELRIGPYYAKATEQILERPGLAGQGLLDLLGPRLLEKDRPTVRLFFDMLLDGGKPLRSVLKLSPLRKIECFFEAGAALRSKHLDFHFRRIERGGKVERLMVLVRDVSEEARLGEAVRLERDRGRSEMELFYRMLHVDPGLLSEFLAGLRDGLRAIGSLLEEEGAERLRERLQTLLRHAHALKGDALLLDLGFIADQAHAFETRIQGLLSNPGEIQPGDFLSLAIGLSELQKTQGQMEALLARLRDFEKTLASLPERPESLLAAALRNLGERAARDAQKKVDLDVSELGAVAIPAPGRKLVRELLVQLVRNAIAHGIEAPAARREAGKGETGRIQVGFAHRGPGWLLWCRDDGGGIRVAELRARAVASGRHSAEAVAALSPAELRDLVFEPGISTAEGVDLHAGRGVGLDLVKRWVEGIRGKVALLTEPGAFTEFRIELPEDAFAGEA
ncbi:MAG: ammonium transporter [Spirochaetes bacterium]|nr:ammonium transporter [Spirochaetota bacterium]